MVGYLAVGLVAGILAAVLGLMSGHSVWFAAACFVLGANVGLVAGGLAAGLLDMVSSRRARRQGRRPGWAARFLLALFAVSSFAVGWTLAR